MKPIRRFSVSYFFYRFLKKYINHKYIREDGISYTLFTFLPIISISLVSPK